MPSENNKSVQVSTQRYADIMFSRVCPGCGDYVIHDVPRITGSDDALERRTYHGTYHCCSGPHGHNCWHMNKSSPKQPNRKVYETFGPESRHAKAA